MTRFKVQDLTSGFRLLSRREALRYIDLLPNTFSYPTTLTLAFLHSGLTVKYVPIQSLYRSGQSKISLITDGIFFLAGLANYTHTYFTQGRFTNMSVFALSTSVIIFMLGLISEQIALLRMERRQSGRPFDDG